MRTGGRGSKPSQGLKAIWIVSEEKPVPLFKKKTGRFHYSK
jgi:hypothetical protein